MFVLHIAIQGCLRGSDVEYGVTGDTGGHIKYLLELVEASECDSRIDRIEIATRAFDDPDLGADYRVPREAVSAKTDIIRFETTSSAYLPKEKLEPELPSFSDRLCNYIASLDRKPDIIHAHYVDGGTVGASVKRRFSIPLLFTAHSLGREKKAVSDGLIDAQILEARIRAEEKVIAAADAIIASSRDEAERQYASYRNYDCGKVNIIVPGSDLDTFQDSQVSESVEMAVAKFLTEPRKPAVLAIARPVRKKNLITLVKAFGENDELQERANLIIVAGTRQDYHELEDECSIQIRDMLHAIDYYDLYGRVAYPKDHIPEDIPAYYALARETGGVFVNPALNEPFGLTLLEAAAAGVPVVATDRGGPNDIVDQCQNGCLVNPLEHERLADTILALIDNSAKRREFSQAGQIGVSAYNWDKHVEIYHTLIRSQTGPNMKNGRAPDSALICDIDNTLVGDNGGLTEFKDWRRKEPDMLFGIATGRTFHSARAILAREYGEEPDVIISAVGTEIHYRSGGGGYKVDEEWRRILGKGWDRAAIVDLIEKNFDFELQGDLEQSAAKCSYFVEDGTADLRREILHALSQAGLVANVVVSHDRYLDILPQPASKGSAVARVCSRYGLGEDDIYVAGDSANDIGMLACFPQSIIVGNCIDGIDKLPALSHSYCATESYARGVVEGVSFFRERQSVPNDTAVDRAMLANGSRAAV